ncbi:unnamed protein product [Dicrocoelium dendriticum]|nr:unnamed protein product [Dicrocoelium dendriticum]
MEPKQVYEGENQSVVLRCFLTRSPIAEDSVYVIWRFRHSTQPAPPANWAFMHQDDDLARCPDPPKLCEFVNQYTSILATKDMASLNDPRLNETDNALITARQLHTLHLKRVAREFDGTFQCYTLVNLDAMEQRAYLRVLSESTN